MLVFLTYVALSPAILTHRRHSKLYPKSVSFCFFPPQSFQNTITSTISQPAAPFPHRGTFVWVTLYYNNVQGCQELNMIMSVNCYQKQI